MFRIRISVIIDLLDPVSRFAWRIRISDSGDKKTKINSELEVKTGRAKASVFLNNTKHFSVTEFLKICIYRYHL